MPNSISALPSSVYKLTHDPTQSVIGDVNSELSKNPYAEMTDAILFGAINTLLEDIDAATGLDLLAIVQPLEDLLGAEHGLLSGLLAFINPADPLSGTNVFTKILYGGKLLLDLIPNIPADIITGLENLGVGIADLLSMFGLPSTGDAGTIFDWATGLLNPLSALDAGNLFGLGNVFGKISIGHLTTDQVELLDNSDFRESISLQGGGIWVWDGTVGRTVLGSARVNATGALNQLVSNSFAVAQGDQLTLSVWAQWSSLVYSGTKPLKLQVVKLLYDPATRAYANMGTVDIAAPSSPAASQATWQQLTGTFTVPSNVSHLALQIVVDTSATAGTVWWDDGSAKKSGLIEMPWVAGLPDQLTSLFGNFQSIVEAGWQSVFGSLESGIEHTVDQFKNALMNIPPVNVVGAGGLPTLQDTFTETWNQLWGGFALGIGTDKSIADAANAASVVSQTAGTAQDLGSWNNAILETRNNKSLMAGMDETSESNFLMDKLFTGGSTPPVEVGANSAVSVPISFWRATEGALKGFVSWYGRGISGVTALYIDIYKFNYTTSQMELVVSSPNVIGQFPSDTVYALGIWNMDVGSRIQVTPGEVYGIGWRSVGGNHYIAGIGAGSWFPNDNTVVAPKKHSATRSSGATTAVPFGSLTYSNNIAWFGFGIVDGDVPPPYHAPRTTVFASQGTNQVFALESWMNIIDVSLCPGGGGGHGGNGGTAQAGSSGKAGTWHGERLIRGVDFPTTATQLIFDIAPGGAGGNRESTGGPGGSTTRRAITGGKAALVATGGAAGIGYGDGYQGGTPGNFVNASGVNIVGGTGGAGGGDNGNGSPGGSPGGGGGGGNGGFYTVAWDGGDGSVGLAHVYAKQS